MADGTRALQGQMRQLRKSMENEAERTRQHASVEAERTRQHLGSKLDSIDGKLDRLVEIAEMVIEDEPWKHDG